MLKGLLVHRTSNNTSGAFYTAKNKRIAEILKTRQRKAKHAEKNGHLSSRSSSRCSGKSGQSKKSMEFKLTSTKSKAKRSHSLLDLRDKFSAASTCVDHINKKYQQTYKDKDQHISFGQKDSEVFLECSDEEDDLSEKAISLSTSLSHLTYSKAQESETQSKQYQKLSSAVKRLHLILHDVQASATPPYRTRSQSPSALMDKKQIPRLSEKDSILKLARMVQTMTKDVHMHVSQFIVTRRKERLRLDESRTENAILKQRLSNSLTIQKNLEGELMELNKEKKLLEVENKNLAIKIAPLLDDNSSAKKIKNKNEPIRSSRRERYLHILTDEDVKNNNIIAMESESSRKCHNPKSAQPSKSRYHCSRWSSSAGLNTRWYTTDECDTTFISRSVSDSNFSVDSTSEDISKVDQVMVSKLVKRAQSSHELDSIASYVRWKSQDFNRLHGKLHKSFEELHQLKETMNLLSQEKNEILADLEDLVDSYRELERERDNYESILKMILKEKNSPESNIRQILDGLLLHLSTATQESHHCCQQHESDPTHQHCSNSKSFLESALQVVQEQNISIREEMAKMRDTLQATTGQNAVLQANNQTMMEKVNDLQKQVESKELEATQKERESKERFEQLDKLYKTILSARDDLENRLQDKEKEIARLNLKNVTDASDKALKEQADKIAELKEANAKLEKEVTRFRVNNEKLNQTIKQFKTDLKEQKGKLGDQYKSTCSELQKSKEQCNWLQNQVENFKAQLVEAHERIKLQEKDKSILAHNVLAAEEERKTLDRNIQEIRTIMEADKVYQKAITERNNQLESEVNRLRTEKLSGDSIMHDTSTREANPPNVKKNREDGDEHPHLPLGIYRDATPLSRKHRHHVVRKHHLDGPRTTVSLHNNPTVTCYRTKL